MDGSRGRGVSVGRAKSGGSIIGRNYGTWCWALREGRVSNGNYSRGSKANDG